MKPLYLTMSAFGSYIQKTDIDFGALGMTGIYLISGDTGSGKSTIFDAITYALFGEVSGGARGEKNLRSDLADLEETYVELEFEHMGSVYRIRRSPEYQRKKLRGQGTVKKPAEASITLPDGETLEGVNRADEKVRDILKMDAKRFKSIVMIAQGDFAKLLTANSADREDILRSIFDTGVFEAFQNQALERAKGLKSSFEQSRDRLNWTFETANAGDEIEKNVYEAEKFAARLDERAKADAESVREKRARLGEVEKKIAEIGGEKQKVVAINALGEEIEATRASLESSAREIDALNEALPGYKSSLDETEAERGTFEELYHRSKSILSRIDGYRELEADRKALAKSKSAAEAAAREIERLGKALAELSGEKAALEKERESLMSAPEALAELTAKKARLERDKADMEKLVGDLNGIKKREARLHARREELRGAVAALTSASENYDALFKSFLAAQAGLLAETLVSGRPCPVCGSALHPSPATLPDTAAREDDVTSARKLRGEAELKAQGLSQSIAAETLLRDESVKSARQAIARVTGNENFESLTGALADVKEIIKQTDASIGEAKAKKARLEAIPGFTANLDAGIAGALGEKAEYEKALGAALEKSAALEAVTQTLEKSLEFESEARARRESDECDKKYRGWASRLESRKKAREGKLMELSALKGKNAALKAGLDEREAAYKRKLDEYRAGEAQKALSTQPFDMELSEQNALSRALYEEIAALEQRASNSLACAEKIRLEDAVFRRLSDDYVIAKSVSDLVNGAGTGEREKISLVRYVQSRLFDTVLIKANRRFGEMSRGQFALERARKSDDRRQKVGLDLNVINNLTGASRAASTLSGGEMFMASLSLALGFADVIRERSGAVVVDCLFVDEGFGSLDEKTLDTVIDVLLKLSGDDKLIGLISHVEQLRERIYRQIIVKRTRQGSTAKVVS